MDKRDAMIIWVCRRELRNISKCSLIQQDNKEREIEHHSQDKES